MSEDNWERRILQSFGSSFRIDVQNPQTTVGGSDIYNLYSITDDEKTCLVGHQQNGIYRVYNMGTIELVGGEKVTESGIDIIIAGKNGDVVINAEKNGRVRIRGKNVTIQADEDIDLSAGRNVNIKSGSGRILLGGNVLEKSGLKGNLLDPEQQWAYRVFEDTGLPAGAFGALISPFSGVANIASVLSAGGIGGIVDSAVSAATGGLVSGVTGGLGGITGGIIDGISGSLSDGLGSLAGDAIGGIAGDALGGIAGDLVGGAAGDLIGGSSLGDVASGLAGEAGALAIGQASTVAGQTVSPQTSQVPLNVRDIPGVVEGIDFVEE